jgi:hypothetical protein
MAKKGYGAAASANEHLMKRSDVDAEITAAASTGLTSPSSGTLAVSDDYRSFPVTFFLSGTVTTGTKAPEFIAPVACTVVSMLGRCGTSSSGAIYRPSKNGGTTDGTASASTTTSVITTAQSVALAAGDRLQLRVSTAGTSADLSVTFWVRKD